MTKQHKAYTLAPTFSRRERGTPLRVTSEQIKLKDGSTGFVHGINLYDAEVPDKTYLAECCGARFENATVRLMFGQPKLGGGMRSLVLISMSPTAVGQFLDMVNALQGPSLDDLVKMTGITPEPLSELPGTEPEQTAALIANMVAAAFANTETCLDFYHANAFTMASLQKTNQAYIEPIVRINTRTALFASLAKRLNDMRSEFPADAQRRNSND